MLQSFNRRKCPEHLRDKDAGPQLSPASPAPPVHYLDTLSKIWLTTGALKELNRRNRQIKYDQQRRPESRRPVTRHFYKELQRRIHSTDTTASNFLQRCSPVTLKQVKALAKNGGPDLLDLRGFLEPAQPSCCTMSSLQPNQRRKREHDSVSVSQTSTTHTKTTATKVTKLSGSAGPNFRQRMINNDIYPYGYEYPDGRFPPKPDEWKEIQQMLTERRASLSLSTFSEEEYEKFARVDAQIRDEDDTRDKIIPMMQGANRNTNRVSRNTIFNNITNMFPREENLPREDGKTGPVNGRRIRPDYYYGAHPDQLPLQIREDLANQILPSTDESRPCVPNFFVETKGPRGLNAVGLNQACIDGAIGTRGIHKLQMYGQKLPKYDNKAYTLSATYQTGMLKMYTHHLGQPNGPGTQPEYYMNQLGAFAMTHNLDTFRQGMAAFRNGVDWTEAKRNAAIEHAKAVANGSINVNNKDNGEDEEDESKEEDIKAGLTWNEKETIESNDSNIKKSTKKGA